MVKTNGYNLNRKRFDFRFENPEKCKSIHTELYTYIVDLWNRFGQKDKFGLPSIHTMELLGIGSKNTFYNTLNDLVDWGFIKYIEKSKNQNTATIISILKSAGSKNKSALDTANIQQQYSTGVSNEVSGGNIDKQINNKTNKQINNNINEELEEVVSKTIQYWNSIEKFAKCRKATKDIYKKMESIMKDYSKQDIEIGFKNYKKDVYSRTEETHGSFANHVRSYYEFICREKGLRLYINK